MRHGWHKNLGGAALPSNAHGHSGSMSVKTTNQHPLQPLVCVTLLAALATPCILWAQANAAPPISGVIGKLQSFTGSSLDVMTTILTTTLSQSTWKRRAFIFSE